MQDALKVTDGSWKTALDGFSNEAKIAAVASLNLSQEMSEATLVSLGFSEAEAAAAASTMASGTAAKGAAVGFKGFGLAVKTAAKSVWTFLTSNPLGWAIDFVAALAAVGIGLDYANKAQDRALERSKNAREEYQSVASEVESINSQLETTQDRISELKAQGPLSLTEAEELSRLETQNEQLERELKIKQKLAQYKGAESASASRDALTTKKNVKVGVYANSFGEVDELAQMDILEETMWMQDQLNEKQAQYYELTEELVNLDPGTGDYQALSTRLNVLDGEINSLGRDLSSNLDTINTEYASLFDPSGTVFSGYESLAERVEEVVDYCLSTEDAAVQAQKVIENILSRPTLKGFVDQLVEMSKAGEDIAFDDIEEQFPQLETAIEDACADGEVSFEDFVNTINSMAGKVNFDEMRNQVVTL